MSIKEHTAYMILDIETEPDIELAKLMDEKDPYKEKLVPDELPELKAFIKDYKVKEAMQIENSGLTEATIKKKLKALDLMEDEDIEAKYMEAVDDYNKALKNLAVNPIYAMIKIARIILDDSDEIITFTNEGLSRKVEKDIIENIYKFLHTEIMGSSTLRTRLLVTFNGKRFDIPLLIERGGVCGANIVYRWLEKLCDRHCDEHYDIIENRSYQNTPVNKLSLSRNLLIRFGPDFCKEKIDFQNCTFQELLDYSEDEMYKLKYWVGKHFGVEERTPIEYLDWLKKKTAKITDDDLPV